MKLELIGFGNKVLYYAFPWSAKDIQGNKIFHQTTISHNNWPIS